MMRIGIWVLLLCCTSAFAQKSSPKVIIDIGVTFLQFKPGPAADKFKADLDKAGSEKGLVLQKGESDLIIRALKTQRGTKVLAEPRLEGWAGQIASFLAGGEAAYVGDLDEVKKSDGTIEYKAVTKHVEVGTRIEFRPDVSADKKSITLDVTAAITQLIGLDNERWSKAPVGRDDLKIQKPKISGIQSKVKASVPDGDVLVIELHPIDPGASTQPTKTGIAQAGVDAESRVIVIVKPRMVMPKAPENAL